MFSGIFISPAFTAVGWAERNDTGGGVPLCVYHNQIGFSYPRDGFEALLLLVSRWKNGSFLRFQHQWPVEEIQSMLLQVGLPLILIPFIGIPSGSATYKGKEIPAWC